MNNKNKSIELNVTYNEGLTISQTVDTISRLESPHIVLWYIGTYGLKKAGVDFYRDLLISPVISSNSGASFWLYDLTAWGAFKNSKISITSHSNHCSKIDKLGFPKIKSLKSSDIFNKMQKISNKSIIKYFQEALSRPFIWKNSENFENTHLSVKDLFIKPCQILSRFNDYDVSKGYSMLQYLEAFLLIEEILSKIIFVQNNIQIVFAIPNDEIKYYRDNVNSFEKDLKIFLFHLYGRALYRMKISINFISFKYGKHEGHRPYNAPGEIIKKLTAGSILNDEINIDIKKNDFNLFM